jgi:hypothetical protein
LCSWAGSACFIGVAGRIRFRCEHRGGLSARRTRETCGATGLRLVDRDGAMQKQTTFGRLAVRVDPPHRASRRLGRLSLPCRVCQIKNHRGRCTCTSWIVGIACTEMAEIRTTHRLYMYFAQSSKQPCDLISSSPIAEVVSKLRLVQILCIRGHSNCIKKL